MTEMKEKLTKAEEREFAQELVQKIGELAATTGRKLRFMEVCGTHTVAIFRAGLRQMLPETVELVSGPGCPVCVTPDDYMDKAIAYAQRDDVIIATFGDMLKVPGSKSSLNEAKTGGADIRIVYSPMDSIAIAKDNPDKKVIFLAVGFETTAPTAAATVLAAEQQGITNLFMLSAQKLVPPVMEVLLNDEEVHVDGFILPGHVSVVTGTGVYKPVIEKYHVPGVVTGFEPVQILRGLYRLVQQVVKGEAKVENEYTDVVKPEGNPVSMAITNKVYEPCDTGWRGMGVVPLSGLKMRDEYARFDIEEVLPVEVETITKKTACRCGEVLRGIVTPKECPLFGKACVPTHAIGPCMVSVEGVCAAWYKYGQGRFAYGK
ncbi:putative hydrogenase expression/formation protein HypD [Selenomonas ruminantium subsp. lactilytica TAM6421]|uniref:Putative hydrogenase expression/formation protein HypD n=2 Tax=Selenomonas ruminantium TaxID=971 RepID=I0GML7_SELRL|nr:putative hydrogenase expression/formation protein HypD [Selenomonas ruminantium subsp. lactilytica TAM6421]